MQNILQSKHHLEPSFLINIFQSYVIVQFLKRGTFNSYAYFLRRIMLTDSIFLREKSVEKLVVNHIRIIKERSFESNATADSSKDIFVTKHLQEKLSVSLYVCLFESFKTFAILNTAFFERIFKFTRIVSSQCHTLIISMWRKAKCLKFDKF